MTTQTMNPRTPGPRGVEISAVGSGGREQRRGWGPRRRRGTRIRPTASLILLALAATAVTGCGGTNGAEISKREYIARSNSICQTSGHRASVQFKRIVGEQGPPKRGEEQRFITNAHRFLREAAIPIIRSNVDQRRKLPVPDGDDEQITAIIAAGERALAGFEHIAADRSRVRALFEGKMSDPAKEFDALSKRYGIEQCGGDQ